MKSILNYIFNVIRNISLAIVLVLISLFIYFANFPDQLISVRDNARAASDEAWLREYIDSEEEETSIASEEHFIQNTIKNGNKEPKEIKEILSTHFKIELEARNSEVVFLRPSQLVSVQTEFPDFILTTIKGQRYTIHNRKYSLTELYELFNLSDSFFKTKNSIVNLHYAENLFTKGGIKRVKMENLEEIDIPEKKVNLFLEEVRKVNQSFDVVK